MDKKGKPYPPGEPVVMPKMPKVAPVEPLVGEDGVVADPMGSYTGAPEDGGKPVQDADDL